MLKCYTIHYLKDKGIGLENAMNKMYKVREQYYLQEIAGENVVIARGPVALQFGGILVLNESCSIMWKKMKNYCTCEDLSAALMAYYGIEEDVAEADVDVCLRKMLDYDLLEVKQ